MPQQNRAHAWTTFGKALYAPPMTFSQFRTTPLFDAVPGSPRPNRRGSLVYERQQRHAPPRRPRRVPAGFLSLVLPVALALTAAVPLRSARAPKWGKASWYGPGLHGKKTASGERFNPQRLTAAHRRLPSAPKPELLTSRTARRSP